MSVLFVIALFFLFFFFYWRNPNSYLCSCPLKNWSLLPSCWNPFVSVGQTSVEDKKETNAHVWFSNFQSMSMFYHFFALSPGKKRRRRRKRQILYCFQIPKAYPCFISSSLFPLVRKKEKKRKKTNAVLFSNPQSISMFYLFFSLSSGTPSAKG